MYNFLELLPWLFFIGFFALIVYLNWRRVERMRAKNYQWYRATYPDAMRGNRVACYSCGNDRVHVRNVMQRTFMREHFCSQCGESLYYSPEGKA
ncbi:hypothetical protein WI80_14655 [Burkholderia ubonensis]|uniref:hypothetical protein n=1 Tax=Burkholderia ubonensis TaxID=101571 RepID=UPI00075EF51A|nr:hypothetical protein [Burkholderia ubonensis]KVD08047.1 hypothetical protein WI80_14655 [Burkholderia ubonensis]KVQ09143.1 hypothetical protein WJ98_03775 [Burkholderia ubonensis]KVU19302.1 hypothetical protein WK63_06670 [Burkholderia ubonensis]